MSLQSPNGSYPLVGFDSSEKPPAATGNEYRNRPHRIQRTMNNLEGKSEVAKGTSDILVIDDDPAFIDLVQVFLDRQGYRSVAASSVDEALDLATSVQPDVILLDQHLGPCDGLDLISPLSEAAPNAPVILVTAHSSVDAAVTAIKRGASDFLPKPIDEARLVATLAQAVEHHRLRDRVCTLEQQGSELTRFDDIIGASAPLQTIYRIIENVAPTDAGVLIVGESGTGKELIAQAIHRRSERAHKRFVALNMGAIPDSLIESTLFGHERGAFTGADRKRVGACEEADGGTLFLDEIREMPIEMQPKLLRFLQEMTIRRVGAESDMPLDVRIISATNSDPIKDIEANRLRADLYYRLNVVPINVPPLRDRPGDVPLLAYAALRQLAARHRRSFESIDQAALERLQNFNWPGNVRELFHVIERAVVLHQGQVLLADMLPPEIVSSEPRPVPEASGNMPASIEAEMMSAGSAAHGVVVPLAEQERRAIMSAIDACGSAASAARALGVSEATIYRRLREYGVTQARG